MHPLDLANLILYGVIPTKEESRNIQSFRNHTIFLLNGKRLVGNFREVIAWDGIRRPRRETVFVDDVLLAYVRHFSGGRFGNNEDRWMNADEDKRRTR